MAKATFVQCGKTIDVVAAQDAPNGTVIVQGDLVGVAQHDLVANESGAMAVEGVYDLPKDGAVAISAGAKVYWDATNEQAVTTATGNKLVGKATVAAAASDLTVRVRFSQ